MTNTESISRITELLNQLPEVCVTSVLPARRRTSLVLYVGSHDSLIAVANSCAAANMLVSVEPADSFKDNAVAPGLDELRYVVRIRHDQPWIEALGAYLVRALLSRRLIALPSATALVAEWNASLD